MDTAYFRALIEEGKIAEHLLIRAADTIHATRSQLFALLLTLERAYLRGESPSTDWMIRQLSAIESELVTI